MAELTISDKIVIDPFTKYLDKKMAKIRAESNNYKQFLSIVERKGFVVKYPETFKKIYWDVFQKPD